MRALAGDVGGEHLADRRPVFRLLVLYRWLSLAPALVALAAGGLRPAALAALFVALALNLLITLFPEQLNAGLRRRPWLLLADMLAGAGLAWLTGGWRTPYYLYAFSPLLAAAFFFHLRGALIAAAGVAGLFIFAGLVPPAGVAGSSAPVDLLGLPAQLVGFFLIAGSFGYASTLLASLQASHAALDRVHRDLRVIHNLTLFLQTATDVAEVQERVLQAVTSDLGYAHAVVALVDDAGGGGAGAVITGWLARGTARAGAPPGVLRHEARLPLHLDRGAIVHSLLTGQSKLAAPAPLSTDAALNAALPAPAYHVFPMLLREHAVGVLLVEAGLADDGPSRLESLQAIASQAAVALGTTMLCIDRAQRLAVQDERLRFARDIHDTLSQSLFGLAYSLDACVKLLPGQPEQVRAELAALAREVETTRATVRQLIRNVWPSEMTAAQLQADLQRYVGAVCRTRALDLKLQIDPGFDRLAVPVRHTLYRIAQEGVANVARHANASQAEVCLVIRPEAVSLSVTDDGCGFEPEAVLARLIEREHFGLHGMRERAAAHGGTFDVQSKPGAGARLLVTLPLKP